MKITKVNEFVINKNTLNSGYIFFEDVTLASKFNNLISKQNIEHTIYVDKKDDHIVYGFKLFRIRNKFLDLCRILKEVV